MEALVAEDREARAAQVRAQRVVIEAAPIIDDEQSLDDWANDLSPLPLLS